MKGKIVLEEQYGLQWEELPNGNKFVYKWNDHDHLTLISAYTCKGTLLTSVEIPGQLSDDTESVYKIKGSDGRFIEYHQTFLKKKKYLHLSNAIYPRKPAQSFTRERKLIQKQGKKSIKIPYLISTSLPDGRSIQIEYEKSKTSDNKYRVKRLLSPIGKGKSLQATHTFHYDESNRTTDVIDALGNKTSYFWDSEYLLTRIDYFAGHSKLSFSETFVWENKNLQCKAYFNENNQPIFAKTYHYDDSNHLIEETLWGNISGKSQSLQMKDGMPIDNGVDRSIKKMSYSQDGKGLLTRQINPNGLITDFTYHAETNLIKSKFLSNGSEIIFRYFYEYDDENILIREICEDGISKTIREITPRKQPAFYGMPEIIQEKYEHLGQKILLRKIHLHYDKQGRVEKKDIFDANHTYRYSLHTRFDEMDRIVSETNACGWETQSKYDLLGNKIYTKEMTGTEIDCIYDLCNRMTQKKIIGFDGIEQYFSYEYNQKNELISETDEYGAQTRYVLDPFGNRKEIHLPAILDEKDLWISPTIQSDFDCMSNAISTIDARGFETKTTYNILGNPICITKPNGATETNAYFLDGSLQSHIDPLDLKTEIKRDYFGQITQKKISKNGQILSQESFEYIGQHLICKIDAEGHRTHYTYDRAGRKISEECEGEKTVYTYDELNRIKTVETATLRTIKQYDLLDRIILEKSEEIQTGKCLRLEQVIYDRAGNKIKIIRYVDGQEVCEIFQYDSKNRLIEKIDPSNAKEIIVYQDHSQKKQKIHTDPMGLITVDTFDAQNKLIKTEIFDKNQNPLLTVDKRYDACGHLTFRKDSIQNRQIKTLWESDFEGNTIKTIEALGSPSEKITIHTYSLRGEKETTTKPNGVRLYYRYNDLGYLTALTSSDGSVDHTMSYNRKGQLISNDCIERQLDAKGRILSEIFPNGCAIQNRYNHSGQRVQCTIPIANCQIEYEHNGFDVTKVIRKTLLGHLQYFQTLTYDYSGNRLTQDFPFNLGKIEYSYDPNSRLTEVYAFNQTKLYNQKVVEADRVGNILKMETMGQKSLFQYDSQYQLISEQGIFHHQYQYNALYCRLSKDETIYEVNDLHQIVSHIEYDANGNPIRCGEISYEFDALDRLIQIKTPTLTQRFSYDFLHRRISSTINDKTSYFLFDGQNEIGSIDENQNTTELRILGPTPQAEIGATLFIELQDKIYIPIHDVSKNIAAILPVDGDPIEITYFSAFGEQLGSTKSPWRFSSKRNDPTGLVYYGRRYYDPSLGRWISPDPAGFTDGINLYTFVKNCPLTHLDEYGLYDLADFPLPQSSPPNSPPTRSKILSPINPLSTRAPIYYVNGIGNELKDSLTGAHALNQRLGSHANVIPAYSESWGFWKDMDTVNASRSQQKYSTPFIDMFKQQLMNDIKKMDGSKDPRKIFIYGFSRGSTDIFHTVKDFTREQKDRLIIMTCGAIKVLPRTLGFKVNNLISEGDWCSLRYHPELKTQKDAYEDWANVKVLEQKDGFTGINKDHFWLSKTYQEGIEKFGLKDYEEFGGAR